MGVVCQSDVERKKLKSNKQRGEECNNATYNFPSWQFTPKLQISDNFHLRRNSDLRRLKRTTRGFNDCQESFPPKAIDISPTSILQALP